MSFEEIFRHLEETVELDRIDAQKLSDDLMKFKKFSKEEITANQSLFKKSFERVVPKILDHINHEKERLDEESSKTVATALRTFRETLPSSFNIFNKRLVDEINSTTRELVKKAEQVRREVNEENQTANFEKKVIEALSLTDQSLSSLELKKESQKKYLTIEGQLEPIEAVLKLKTPETFSDKTIPPTIQYLNKYAISQGYKTIGSITNAPGRAYIGRMEVKDGNQEYIVPFPKNEIKSGTTPNILNNFRYYAGKTMNAWNEFVEAENKLVSFVEKIETSEKRQEYILDQLKSMTLGTFSAQILATLTYYYLFIPLENFMKFNHKDYDGTMESFMRNYNVAPQLSKNPLLLKKEDGLWIARKLIVTKDPVSLWKQIEAEQRFKDMKNLMNRLNFETLLNYYDMKLSEARTFFVSTGTMEESYRDSLGSHKIVGIKKRKFVIPSMFSNPEITMLLEKINKKDEEEESWSLTWGSEKIMCHDYVWEYKL